MCVVIVAQKKKPSLALLKMAENTNRDGGGMAWVENGSVNWVKGIKAREMFKLVQSVELPFICHFRISTVGGKTPYLCHPFPISENAQASLQGKASRVLFHNGNWTDWRDECREVLYRKGIKFPGGKWSDTRAMAWLAHLFGQSFLGLLDEKIAILSNKKTVSFYGRDWDTSKDYPGLVFSNLYWEFPRNFSDSVVTRYPGGYYGQNYTQAGATQASLLDETIDGRIETAKNITGEEIITHAETNTYHEEDDLDKYSEDQWRLKLEKFSKDRINLNREEVKT